MIEPQCCEALWGGSAGCLGYNEISALLVDVGTCTVLIVCGFWEVFSLCVVSWSLLSSFLPSIMCISSGVYRSTSPRQTSHLLFSALESYQLGFPKLWSHLHSGPTSLALASLFCFVEWKVPLVWARDTLQVPLLVSFLMSVSFELLFSVWNGDFRYFVCFSSCWGYQGHSQAS